MARHLGAHLCRCTGYVKILDAVEAVAHGERRSAGQPPAGASGAGARSTRPRPGPGRPRLRRRPAASRACCTPPFTSAAHARADVRRIDTAAAQAAAGRGRRVHRGRRSRRSAGRHHPQRLAGLHPRGRAHLLPRRRAGDRRGRDPPARPRGRRARRGRVRAAAAHHRSAVAAVDDSEDAVWGTDGNVLSRSVYQRGDVDAALAGSRPRRARGVPAPSGSSTPSSSPSRRWPSRSRTARLHVYSGGQGIWDDRDQIASVLGVDRPGHRRAGLQRRRLRRQGGHVQPGPDGAGRLARSASR